ncbi:MAG: hypothetical protein ABSD59_01675 [Terracidiphilus sp.]|jgi:hypothetical protein
MQPSARLLQPLLLILGLALAAVPAFADTTYDYTGQDYTVLTTGSYNSSMSMTGSFTVASPLGGDFSATPGLISWQFNDGVITWNWSDASIVDFSIVTNATGAIDDWFIGLSGNSGYLVISYADFDIVNSGNGLAYSGVPGVWSETSLVPEPAGYLWFDLSFCALVVGVLAKGRRRVEARAV